MLRWRLTMAPVLIGTFVGICWLDHRAGAAAPYLFGLILLLGARCTWEMAQLLNVRSFRPNVALATLCVVGIVSAKWIAVLGLWIVPFQPDVRLWNFGEVGPYEYPVITGSTDGVFVTGMMSAASVLLLLLSGCIRYREPGRSMESLGAEMIIVSYVGVLLSMTAQLRWVAGSNLGYLALGSLVVATKCGDIGAYTLGRLFGKKKMVPLLSPGKTWMGAWGAVLGATAGSVAWFQFGSQMFPSSNQLPCDWYWSALFGAVLGVVGLIGDLAESLIKRDVGAKDAPALIPGFGGLLDVLDSILYAGPVAYILWLVLPLAPH